jgi:hypothetical protein
MIVGGREQCHHLVSVMVLMEIVADRSERHACTVVKPAGIS